MEKGTEEQDNNTGTGKKLSIPSTVFLTVMVTLIAIIIVGIGFVLFN